MTVTRAIWGATAHGTPIERVTLARADVEVSVITWGACIQALRVPDRRGTMTDVVLGFDTLAPYLDRHPNFGVTVGRYANRIAHARFALDGVEYRLAANNGRNALHGGPGGFARRVWDIVAADAQSVGLAYTSPDGEEGYPGTLRVAVTYALDDANGLVIDYEATTDRATVVNLTNHSYFDLGGTADIREHVLALAADWFLPVDEHLIPTGELREVARTPFDFSDAQPIGARFAADDEQLRRANGGYDHTYVLGEPGTLRHVARVHEASSGRVLDVATTQPGVQLYTGNNLDGRWHGKGGMAYGKYAGFCLETQHLPDSPNQPQFPSTVLRPGETYRQTTVYRFIAESVNKYTVRK